MIRRPPALWSSEAPPDSLYPCWPRPDTCYCGWGSPQREKQVNYSSLQRWNERDGSPMPSAVIPEEIMCGGSTASLRQHSTEWEREQRSFKNTGPVFLGGALAFKSGRPWQCDQRSTNTDSSEENGAKCWIPAGLCSHWTSTLTWAVLNRELCWILNCYTFLPRHKLKPKVSSYIYTWDIEVNSRINHNT